MSSRTYTILVFVIAAIFAACGAMLPAPAPSSAAAPCPVDILRNDAICSSPAPNLYEYDFADGRRAWCRDGGSAAWCSVPVAPAKGSGSGG